MPVLTSISPIRYDLTDYYVKRDHVRIFHKGVTSALFINLKKVGRSKIVLSKNRYIKNCMKPTRNIS